jgi:hypothetical protein
MKIVCKIPRSEKISARLYVCAASTVWIMNSLKAISDGRRTIMGGFGFGGFPFFPFFGFGLRRILIFLLIIAVIIVFPFLFLFFII